MQKNAERVNKKSLLKWIPLIQNVKASVNIKCFRPVPINFMTMSLDNVFSLRKNIAAGLTVIAGLTFIKHSYPV